MVCEPHDRSELRAVIEHCNTQKIPFRVIGGGNNVFFADEGFRGCVICLRKCESNEILFFDNEVYASAAMSNSAFVKKCANKDLGGIEFIACIPGTLGGALMMNAGCKDHGSGEYHEIGSFVRSVDVLKHGQEVTIPATDITFSYRTSSLQGKIILGARYLLQEKERNIILSNVKATMVTRNAVVPWGRKTLGSIFKNPGEGRPSAGELLDKVGMKGERRGDVVVSAQHANVFENKGKGTAEDMWALIEHARKRVYEHFGIRMELEVEYIK